MQKRNYKGRCEKLLVSKSKDVCHIYNDIQKKYLFKLQDNQNIKEIRCNVFMEGLELGEFVLSVVNNKNFTLPKTGGYGTIIFTLAGCAAALGGVLVVTKKSKKRTSEN